MHKSLTSQRGFHVIGNNQQNLSNTYIILYAYIKLAIWLWFFSDYTNSVMFILTMQRYFPLLG